MARSVKPLLLVDVDGVLCPYFDDGPLPGYELADVGAVEVWVWRRHGEWLRELSEWFELVWATTWEAEAERLLSPLLGLPSMPVIEFTSNGTGETWKLPDIAAYVGDREFAWIDDDIGEDAVGWAEKRTSRTLLLRVDGTVGLTEVDYVRLLAWGQAGAAQNP